jgi:hypothetical protein
VAEGAVRSYFVELTGSSEGLVRSVGEGEAAAARLEGRVGTLGNSFQVVGSAANTHLGGTATSAVGKVHSAIGALDDRIKGMIGSIVSAGAQFATFGAAAGIGAFLFDGVKNAEDLNKQMAQLAQAEKDAGIAIPQSQIDAETDSMMRLGVNATDTVQALTQMTAAHVPLAEQMDTLQAAEDLAASKGIDLQSSLSLVEKAAEGQGADLSWPVYPDR